MLINFNILKTFYSALIQKIKGFRGNWNQNDPAADDYIKNRPFYSEGVKEKTIVNWNVDFDSGEIVSTMDAAGPTVYQAIIEDTSLTSLKIGQKYTVLWDSKTYECVAEEVDGIGAIGNASYLGYMTAIGYEDTGEPFFISILDREAGVVFGTEAGKHTCVIKTVTEVIHKLDKKFIDMPDGIVTDDSLSTILEDTLAPVAFTNNYNSLYNQPMVYTDVVRYGANQNLTDNQKLVARNNIGAGTSNFSGSYDDLQYKPCGIETARTEFLADSVGNANSGHNSNIRFEVIKTGNTTMPTVGRKYEVICCKDYSDNEVYRFCTTAVNPSGHSLTDCITIGNPYLSYKLCENTEEPICVLFSVSGQINCYIDKYVFGINTIYFYINEITEGAISTLDERLIPDTIARTEDILPVAEATMTVTLSDSDVGLESFSYKNGNVTYSYYKVSEKYFDTADIISSVVDSNIGSHESNKNGVYRHNGMYIFDNAGNYTIDMYSCQVPSAGIYF